MGGDRPAVPRGERTLAARAAVLARRIVAARRLSPSAERALLLVAAAGMVLAAVLALRDGRVDLSQVQLAPLVLVATVGVPLTVVSNAAEYRLTARATGVAIPWWSALRTTLLATAANLLPLPGGPLVRLQALRQSGVAGGRATQVTLAAGISWIAVAAGVAAAGALVAGAAWGVVAPLAALTLVSGGGAYALLSSAADRARVPFGRIAAALVAVELLSVAAAALRLWLVLEAVGAPGGVPAAAVLALAGVLGTVVGVVPAGLGVREALSALLAVAVALPAATGFLISVVDRVVGLAVVAPVAMLLGLRRSGPAARDEVAR